MLEDNYVGVPVWEISGRESMFPLRESDMPYFFGGLILVASV